MKNNKKILTVLIFLVVLGFVVYLLYPKNTKAPIVNDQTPANSAVSYTNPDYGFTFSLPDDWKGYTVVQNTWTGSALNSAGANQTGPKLLIRNPKWTENLHYEDIPILVFTTAQWNSYMKEDFAVSAAPIPASKLAENNTYVFALPPRWDFDYSEGFKEAEDIVQSKPIKTFDLNTVSFLKDGRQCFTYNHEATKIEPYKVNEFIDININGTVVSGTKKGTQAGPDMTNGYSGTITGTLSNNLINDVFAYVVEGSSNKEKEIYRARQDQIGIEKLRYPLIEKNGTLVPDTTKAFNVMLYSRVGCTASN